MSKLIVSNKHLAPSRSLHATVVRRSAETSIFEGARLSSQVIQRATRSRASVKNLAKGI